MQFEKIIVVDDDPLIRRMLVNHLQKQEITVLGVANCQQAQEEFQKEPADLLIIDLLLPDGDGLGLMQTVKKISPAAEVIIMTGFGTIESAVEAMKQGAANYLLKPFTLPQFDVALQQILEKKSLKGENTYLREQLESEAAPGSLLYQSPEMERIIRLIKRVAPTNAIILIEGESGTGKELVSRAIHFESLRKDKPYIKVNCAAVPENLLESEFFGHEKGAFTGAIARREGRFELANGGTLLLDEVTEISLGLQAKLLRVLQEQEFERVGGTRTIHVDVRVVATTNRDLNKAVAEGKFRQDLYFRLNVVPMKLPPLRERAGEVEYLLKCMLDRFARKHNKAITKIHPDALQKLKEYHWPGNVRELQNYAERAVILSEGESELEFNDFITLPTVSPSSRRDAGMDISTEEGFPTIEDMERKLINMALKKTDGHRNEAAKMLGINVRTLRNKLHGYGEPDTEPEEVEA
ncbi:MAG: sigma-54-dependent transcriptional regulator [Verrucomicrobiota bacterium]